MDLASNGGTVHHVTITQQGREAIEKALALRESERLELVRVMIERLEDLEESSNLGVDRAWEKEIPRRISDLDSGRAKTIPWEEVQRRIAATIDRYRK